MWIKQWHYQSFVSKKEKKVTMSREKNKILHKSSLSTAVDFRTNYVTKHMLRTCHIWHWYQPNILIRPLVIRLWFCLPFAFSFFFLVKFRLISFCFEFALQVTPFSNFVLELKFNKKKIIFCDKKYKTSMRNQRTLKAMHWYESILELDFLNCHYNFFKDNDNNNLHL